SSESETDRIGNPFCQRGLEITLLEELVSGLSATTSHIWMATIINKQDLWNTEYGKVKDHYNKGQYADIIARTTSKLGSKNFQHEYIPTSLAISNLTTASGQVVAKTTEGFDVNSRNESLRKLSQKLNLLVSQ
ncbi:hypothetical protein, partial [uncultured Sphingosinicella sp.]|uniref:hypothetical protein n=1 Tax=uncultured Sphingosinicella sp. TaxID=478748 RepID=UPI0030D9543B